MIVVTATMTAKPGQEEALRELCASVLSKTRLEPGCVQYDCGVSIEDPRQLQFVEVWDDMEALKAHTMTEHMANFGPTADELTESQVIDAHFADKTRRLKPRPEPGA